jgi:calcium/calmodulin-dependent protein kinase I
MDKLLSKVRGFLNRDSIEKHYDLKGDVGSGAFSVVRKAVDKETGEEVAVKVIDKKRAGQKKEMLETEVAILQKVHHPNIVELKCMFENSTQIYLVMELVLGGELLERIIERGSYTEKEAAQTAKELLAAVQHLHSLGIAHRDLKPENLLCTSKDKTNVHIKLTDFGLSKIMPANNTSDMMTACGTPGYVAPEVLKCEGYGKEVDLWSTGVILYILLCGFPPFHESNNGLLFQKIMAGDYSFPRPYWDNISDPSKDLVRKLLTVNPDKRITAEQALAHPWIVSGGSTGQVAPEALLKMKEYSSSRKLIKPIAHPSA